MSRSLRGLTRGFQEGLKIGGTLRGIRRDQDLANESERYGVTEGAYGQGLGENVQQVQGLQQQALEQARYQGASEEDLARIESQYAPSIAELTRRQSLTAPDFTIASRSMRPEDTFATREAAEMAAKPMRTQGLARVYREAGEIEKADELIERADQQELRVLQREAAGLALKKGRREEKQVVDFDTGYAEINKQKFDKPEDRTAG
jgi:delta 1-pyrroline-5-carboxylate dehydrogenase